MASKLQERIKELRAKEEAMISSNSETLLFWGTYEDEKYLSYLKPHAKGHVVHLRTDAITTIGQVYMACKSKYVQKIITTRIDLLKLLLKWDKKKAPSLSDYSGSYFVLPSMPAFADMKVEVVFMNPLKQLITVNYGSFIAARMLSKFTRQDKWYVPTEFTGYTLLTPAKEDELYKQFELAFLIAVDIETAKDPIRITCVSYTAFFPDSSHPSGMRSISVELPMDSMWAVAVMRKWNNLPAAKVLQNGKYDISYFFYYNAPLHNYLYDTATMMHCMYCELPKDLGFLNSFFLREAFYWKDLADTTDLDQYYRYNSLDTWGTGNCFLAMIKELPKYAADNYCQEFPLIFPCHMCEMTGIARDMSKMEQAIHEQQSIIDVGTRSLNKILGVPAGQSFNVKSPVQMKALFKLLGCGDLKSQDAKNIQKARFRHPLNARILSLVVEIREARTLLEKYLQTGAKAKEFGGNATKRPRILYALNPHGTDSGRLASKEHHFWTGLQIQNIPAGPLIKQTIVADPGFLLAEADLEQAESRDTAYISGDEHLINNVEHSPDFHSANASAFFGVPFEEIFDAETHTKLNEALRSLAKRVNHGANYNMGPHVLVDTMGEANVMRARNLLGLPKTWGYIKVAEYLLGQFHKTYPKIRGYFYAEMTKEVMTTHKLVSKAWHHSWEDEVSVLEAKLVNDQWEVEYPKQQVWTRVTFGKPDKSKRDLNSYISHPPQSLNAMTLNKAFLAVFYDIALNPKYAPHFKLLAQIHDSILFEYRKGHEYLCDMVKERMEIPVTIKAYDGKVRTFVVPAAVKNGSKSDKGYAEYWSETE